MKKNYVTLEEVCVKGSSNIAQKDLEKNEGKYPIYGASGFIKNVDFYAQDKPYIAVVKDGAGIGRTMMLPAHSSVIGTMQYLLPKDNIDISYLYYAVTAMNLAKYYTGATIPHIYFKDYRKEKLPVVDKIEQKKIVEVLSKIDALVIYHKRQLDDFEVLLKSRFIEMFGDPVENTKNWAIIRLSELGELNRGVSKHRPRNDKKLLGGKYPLIQTGDIAASDLYIKEYKATYSEEGLKQSKMWPSGILCITIAANIAKTAILDFSACFPDSVVGFNSYERVTNIYMHFWFTFIQKILEEQAPESAQKNINLKILSELSVMVPPIELQNKFADFVEQVNKSKLEVQKSLEELETLKKSLMQQYFG